MVLAVISGPGVASAGVFFLSGVSCREQPGSLLNTPHRFWIGGTAGTIVQSHHMPTSGWIHNHTSSTGLQAEMILN
jgi:hypothetical protein